MAVGNSDLVIVAVILGAHGVRGDVRVKSFTDVPKDAFSFGPLSDDHGETVLTPMKAREVANHFIVTPKERLQKEDWDVMKGRELHVPRGALPETEDDAFYVEDLVGLTAHHPGGEKIGEIRAVQNFGASDLLEILPETSDQTVFIPLTEEDVPEIDLKTGRVIVASYSLWTEGGDDGPDGSSEDGDADGADGGDGGA